MADDNPYVRYNGRWVTKDSPEGQEAAKWEKPYQYVRFPAMLYKAQRLPGNGKWLCAAPMPSRFGFRTDEDWDRAKADAVAFTADCQCIVKDEREYRQKLDTGEGWQDTPEEAVEWQLNLEKIMGQEAAERAYRDRNMSEAAKAESAAAEAEHFGHLPSIPEKKTKRKYTRKQKADSPAA